MKKRIIKLISLTVFIILLYSTSVFAETTNITSNNIIKDNESSISGQVKNYSIYTYDNVPENIKNQIKIHNKTISSSIKIFVLNNNTNNIKNKLVTPNYYYNPLFFVYDAAKGEIQAFKDNSVYYAYTSDYIGYGHITYGQKVAAAQVVLSVKTYLIGIDSAFGGETYGAITYFQGKFHIPQDGIIGPTTWSYLVN